MRVIDLFSACDKEILLKKFTAMDDITADEKTVRDIFQRLDEITAEYSDNVIIGAEYVNLTDNLPPRIEITLYDIAEVKEKFKAVDVKSAESITDEELAEIGDILAEIDSYSISMDSWAAIMGYKLYEGNVSALGNERFMSEILWEMTSYGYSEKEISKTKREVSSEISKRSSNKMAEDYVSFDDMISTLLGGMPQFSEEEERSFSLESATNMLSSYKALCDFYKNGIDC